MHTLGFTVNSRFRLFLKDIGICSVNVLRRAKLPEDLFNRETASLSTDEWFRLWHGIEDEANDPLLPIKIGQVISFELFDPPIFAAMCSQDLNAALERIAKYKKLCAPMELIVEKLNGDTWMEIRWLDTNISPPAIAVLTELVSFVQLSRLATREMVHPHKVVSPIIPENKEAYHRYFGVDLDQGEHPALLFSARDASLPFLTVNNDLLKFFEPELEKRLAELDMSASTSERVQTALLELLPGGNSSIESICKKLGLSRRTLQRRLTDDHTTYRSVLNKTRSLLAVHYLKDSNFSETEISFFLGFDDPNSFFRAFKSWTGETPEHTRRQMKTRERVR